MTGFRCILCALAILAAPGPSAAQGSAPECAAPLADCLIAEANAAVELVSRTSSMDEIHFAVAVALGDLGRFDAGLDAAWRIDDPRTMAEALGEIAGAAARAGAFPRAREIAMSIVDGRVKSAKVAALETLAVHLAAAGRIEEAFDTVIAIDNPFRGSPPATGSHRIRPV